jgi:hypothetical protein
MIYMHTIIKKIRLEWFFWLSKICKTEAKINECVPDLVLQIYEGLIIDH